ncbi:hypothetical protein [Streptomyces sp. CB01881]|uniref:hypothetical protein n=1 Tax=Streptomyces sp. CB01881 TaxID=2078691 RepID=UPI00129D1853|nr:hypothetical protein [Streptomyces sp. CB01881]
MALAATRPTEVGGYAAAFAAAAAGLALTAAAVASLTRSTRSEHPLNHTEEYSA